MFADAIQGLTFTEVVKDVLVIDAATKAESSPKVGDVLVAPNVLKTGADSRAELVAEDKTVTRVGSNTIFSVEVNSRDVNLAQGNVLFNAPKGKGGGRIKSAGATASVLGTTFITSASPSGGFKVMGLEGSVQVDGSKGGSSKIGAGQLSFALPGGKITPPLSFDLKAQVSGSKLVGGFSKPLASIAKIEAAINVQQAKIASGALASTGLLLGDRPDTAFKVDPSTIRSVVAQVLAQVAAEKETASPSGNVVDPRLLKAFQQRLILSSPTASASVAPWTMQLASTDVYSAYLKDGQSTLWISPSTASNPYSLVSRDGIAYTQIEKVVDKSDSSTLFTFQSSEDSAKKIYLKQAATGGLLSVRSPDPANAGGFIYSQLQLQGADFAPESSLFNFSGGKTNEGWLSPQSIPGDRSELGTGNFVSLLTGKDLDFSLAGSGSAPAGLLLDPQAGGLTDSNTDELLPKDGTVILALNDMRLNGSILFDGLQDMPLLISVGRTLTLTPGTLLRADTSLLEIYVAGTGFSPDRSLAEQLPVDSKSTTPAPLTALKLDQVAIINKSTAGDAMVRITAPAITITDSAFQVLPWSTKDAPKGSLVFESSGDISWTATKPALVPLGFEYESKDVIRWITSTTKSDLVPLGFGSAEVLFSEAFNVRITSKKSAVTLASVNLRTNDTRLSAGSKLSFTNVVFDLLDFLPSTSVSGAIIKKGISTVTVPDASVLSVGMLVTGPGIADGTTIASVDEKTSSVTLSVPALADSGEDTVTLGLPTTFISGVAVDDVTFSGVKAGMSASTYLNSTGGNVSVDNSEFGSVLDPTDRAPVTSFIAKALGSISLMNSKICADNTELFGGADVIVSNVTIKPTDSTKGTVKVTGKTITVYKPSITAYQINFNATGEVNVYGKSKEDMSKADVLDGNVDLINLTASATSFKTANVDTLTMQNVNFSAVQNVALDATTLVIRDTQFKDGSMVALNSRDGLLAGSPGTGASVQRGLVNIVSGVKYGTTEIKLPNATSSMTNAQFHTEANTALGNALNNITIGTKPK